MITKAQVDEAEDAGGLYYLANSLIEERDAMLALLQESPTRCFAYELGEEDCSSTTPGGCWGHRRLTILKSQGIVPCRV